MDGQVVKSIGGFYFVENQNQRVRCRGRGLLKRGGKRILVGDLVQWQSVPGSDGIIEKVLPRKNAFIRPPIANVGQMVIMMALTNPEPNLETLDRFLIEGTKNSVETIICMTKLDLDQENRFCELKKIYGSLYPFYGVSGKTGEGIAALKEKLKGKNNAFAGPSGVGKSTLINTLYPEFSLETGPVSGKTGRGKHTTRSVELFSVQPHTTIFDTPGFTSFVSSFMDEKDLAGYFPEMKPYLGKCRYDNCLHVHEPGCAIHQRLAQGEIHSERYQTYRKLLSEIEKEKEKLY